MSLLVWDLASYVDNPLTLSAADPVSQVHLPCLVTMNISLDQHTRLLQHLCRFCRFWTDSCR